MIAFLPLLCLNILRALIHFLIKKIEHLVDAVETWVTGNINEH